MSSRFLAVLLYLGGGASLAAGLANAVRLGKPIGPWPWLLAGWAGLGLFLIMRAIMPGLRAPGIRDAKILAIATGHADALARRRLALIRHDVYGVELRSGWDKEIQHFLTHVVTPALSEEEARTISDPAAPARLGAGTIIDTVAREHAVRIERELAFRKGMTPLEYELYCAALLQDLGWSTTTTKGSGDQGGDVIAEKGTLRVVIQCKLYAKPVGNKAVQEAHASRDYYRAAHAAVVSNAGYTQAAEALAASTGVRLLHHADLAGLEKDLSRI